MLVVIFLTKNCPDLIIRLSGQALTATQTQALATLDPNAPWHQRLIVKHRRLVGVAIPFFFFQVIWWSSAINYDFWSLFPERYFISITMIFGSMIAGKKMLIVLGNTLSVVSLFSRK